MVKKELAKKAACEPRFLTQEMTSSGLRSLYLDEFGEYLEARELVLLGEEPMHMLAEAGDLGVLYLQLSDNGLTRDVELIHQMVLEDLELTGVDMDDCIIMKNLRNSLKYPSGVLTMNGFNYHEYKTLCREFWDHMGGDEVFYQAYMVMAEELNGEVETKA